MSEFKSSNPFAAANLKPGVCFKMRARNYTCFAVGVDLSVHDKIDVMWIILTDRNFMIRQKRYDKDEMLFIECWERLN